MPEERPVDVLWEGVSECMSGGVGSIPRSKDGMGDNSRMTVGWVDGCQTQDMDVGWVDGWWA